MRHSCTFNELISSQWCGYRQHVTFHFFHHNQRQWDGQRAMGHLFRDATINIITVIESHDVNCHNKPCPVCWKTMYNSSTANVWCTVQSYKLYSKLLSLILDIVHTVTRSQFMKFCVHYSVYVIHNSYVSSRVLRKKFNFCGHFVFITHDLNVRIQLGKQLFWIQHIQIM